jgi:flagellar hook protein FlgE
MGSAISIGTTGLAASSKQMDVIGNNLANSNTLGFKAGTTYFASMLNQSLSSSGALAVGQGVTVSAVATQFAQGSFETTGNATDLAIDGEGFFVLQDVNDASFYTRAGAFHVNKEGLLVDGNNYTVQGFSVPKTTASISTDTEGETLQDISFDNAMSNAKATTEVSIGANLDDTTAYGEKFNVSQTVFDSRGLIHNLSIAFLKTEGNGMWGFDVKLDDTNLSNPAEQQAFGLTFDKNGDLLAMYTGALDGAPAADDGGSATVGTIVETTVNKPGQLYKTVAGIELTKGTSAGVWEVTNPGTAVDDPGYDHAIAWQETVDGNEFLKVDLDGKGGSDIAFNIGASTGTAGAPTETATVTFAAAGLVAGDSITIAGLTYTATGVVTAADVATSFATGVAAGLGGFTGTLTDYTAAAGAAGITVFTSTTTGTDVTNLTETRVGAPASAIAIVQGGNQWTSGNTVTFNVEKTDVALRDVTLTFGSLSSNLNGEVSTIGLASGTAANPENQINWDLAGDTAKTITGYASSSVLKSLSDNGYAFGVLNNISVERDGIINGYFTNGQTSKLGQILLANFRDLTGLKKIGNYFAATSSSGQAITNMAGSSGLGEIMNNSLEISNTDVAKEFINMITAQRAYQANSQVITTSDQMLTVLMNIKR